MTLSPVGRIVSPPGVPIFPLKPENVPLEYWNEKTFLALEELHVINLSSDFTHHFVFFFGILFSLISMNESHSNFFSNNSCRVLWSLIDSSKNPVTIPIMIPNQAASEFYTSFKFPAIQITGV